MGEDRIRFDRLLAPRSVAVIGSLSAPHKVGARTLDHLERAGFAGDVQALTKVDDLERDVDVAVVAVPAAAVPDVLTGLRGRAAHAVVFSSGFGEAGGETLAAFHDDELCVLGPNTVGVYVAATSSALAFAQALGPVIDWSARSARAVRPDAAALVTQSGAFGARVTSAAMQRALPLGTFVATGNEDGLTLPDVLEGLAASQVVQPKVVLVYLEAVRDGTRLQQAVAALVAGGSEVLVLPGGRSASGARAASSHTAALVSDGDVLVEALTAAGATVVDGDRELLDGLAARTLQPRAAGRRVAVLTGSGGAGVVAADLLSARGLTLPTLGAATQARLAERLPAFAATTNPVDVTASAIADLDVLTGCVQDLAASGEVDLVVTIGRGPQGERVQQAAAPVPSVMALLDGTTDDLRALAELGVLAAGDLSGAATMAAVLARPAAPTGPLHLDAEGPPAAPLAPPVRASDSLELVEAHGLAAAPWQRAATVAEAVAVGEALGWPVVVKADLPADVHKAKAGGVRLDVTADRLPAVAEELLAAAPGLVVAAQRRASLELFAGARRDEHFGIVVVAGLGGSHVELLGRTLAVPASTPPARLTARLDEAVFRGAGPPGLAERLADAALALARLVAATGADAAECNPLIDTDPGLIALDARVVLP